MSKLPPMTEFGLEPVPGLPKQLPEGDGILWQGAPHWFSFARRVFHVNLIAAWFLFLSGWRMLETIAAGQSPAAALLPVVILLGIGAAAIGFFLFVGWLVQRTTIYTLTRERLIMRVGIALPITVNIPYGLIESAAVKTYSDGTGNLVLKLNGKDRAAYVMLWPHVRPWRLGQPQPSLRAIPEAAKVAGILAEALPEFQARHADDEATGAQALKPAGHRGQSQTEARTRKNADTDKHADHQAAHNAGRATGMPLPGPATS